MSDPPPPLVRATLPDGTVVDGTLAARRQDQDGQWWYHVTIPFPAEAVEPVAGQDYSMVPTSGAKRWVLQSLPPGVGGRREVVLHRAGCWAAGRDIQLADTKQARLWLREKWAVPCNGCTPESDLQS